MQHKTRMFLHHSKPTCLSQMTNSARFNKANAGLKEPVPQRYWQK